RDDNANGKRFQPTSVNETNRRSRRKKATRTRTPRAGATPAAEQTPTPSSEPIIIDTPERTSAIATPHQSPSPIVQEPQTAVPPKTGTLVEKRMATPPSEQAARQPDAGNSSIRTPTGSDDSQRSLSAPAMEIPKPPRTIDEQTVARLDALYQSAV